MMGQRHLAELRRSLRMNPATSMSAMPIHVRFLCLGRMVNICTRLRDEAVGQVKSKHWHQLPGLVTPLQCWIQRIDVSASLRETGVGLTRGRIYEGALALLISSGSIRLDPQNSMRLN